MGSKYYTYILRCKDNSLYTGITTDIQRRIKEHFSKSGKCAKYTKTHTARKLEAVWESDNRVLASKLEYRIKQLVKARKEYLIEHNYIEIMSDKIDVDNYRRVNFTMEIFDKASWQIDGGIPEELVVRHFNNVFCWLDNHGMLSEEGKEELEDGIDDSASLNDELVTEDGAKFLREHYDEYLGALKNGKYGSDESIGELERIYSSQNI